MKFQTCLQTKMSACQQKYFLFLQFISICSLLLFLRGFFPHERFKPFNTQQTQGVNNTKSSLKLVLLIIDSLRVDFLDSTVQHTMPFLQKSVMENKTCFLVTRAAAPTVTMPRIKAITSGYVPSYIDVVLNFDSTEFSQDTFLRQASERGLRAVFYGDDTWLKMFPNTFIRSAGVHSFFAADFWQVDQNVSKNMEKELQQSDWDIMILHYLGLDHIGHMEGPYSSHIGPKLKEMDDVIKRISDSLTEKNVSALFIVTGDHGMKNSGGHGGVTNPEIQVPLASVGRPCLSLPGWPHPWEHIPPQIDIASTIAVALNLPIPSGNIGKIMPHLLNEMNESDILKILKSQKHHLLEHYTNALLYEASFHNNQRIGNHPEDAKYMANKYFHDLSELSEEITRQQSDFHLTSIVMGTVFLWIILTAALGLLVFQVSTPTRTLHMVLIGGTLCHTLSLLSTSFIEEEHQTWYLLWATFLLFSLRDQLRQKLVMQSFVPDKTSCLMVLMFLIHRVYRKLNQTGDKWANLPDLEDYLRSNPTALWIIFMLGLMWTFCIFAFNSTSLWGRILFLAVLLSILCYRLATRILQVPLIESYPQSKGSLEVNVFFIALFLFGVVSAQQGVGFHWMWALLSLLTHRPHNVVLVPGLITVSSHLHSILPGPDEMVWNSFAHVWVGSLFYFYQGNSNSLANVDVAAGFMGLEEYSVAYAGFLIALNTFSAPILSFLLSNQSYSPVIFVKLLPLTLYCTTLIFQRHHLFVWSVFSPKLLLDSALYVILFIFFACHYSHKILSGKNSLLHP